MQTIELSDVKFLKDIPEELNMLNNRVNQLLAENKRLKVILKVIGVCTAIVVLYYLFRKPDTNDDE